jgi:hypothetical protein
MKSLTATHASPYGNSRVTLRQLTCSPCGNSRVKAYGNSRVTLRQLTCEPTRELPFKHGYTAWTYKLGLNLFSFDFAGEFFSDEMQASCAAVAALTSFWLVVSVKDKKKLNASEARS